MIIEVDIIIGAIILIAIFTLQVKLILHTWKLEKEVYLAMDKKDAIIASLTIQRDHIISIAAKMQLDSHGKS